MPHVARADLEALLRVRKLDTTLTTAIPHLSQEDRGTAGTGFRDLDRSLGGGLPRGQMSEIDGPRSSGRFSLLVSTLAQATASGEVVALIDPLDMLDPPSAAAAGVDLSLLLWVRGTQSSPASVQSWFADRRRVRGAAGASRDDWLLDRAVKAVNLVLQAGGFGVVALDVGEVPPAAVKRLPFTTWLRLQRVVEGSETAFILVGREPIARSAGGVTLEVSRSATVAAGPGAPACWLNDAGRCRGVRWAGGGRRARRFLGFDLDVRIVHARWRGDVPPCRVRIGEENRERERTE
ncbi:MAG: hypothetical protein ACE148_00460 [Vicinamibacterales bacterium]